MLRFLHCPFLVILNVMLLVYSQNGYANSPEHAPIHGSKQPVEKIVPEQIQENPGYKKELIKGRFISNWLHMLDHDRDSSLDDASVVSYAPKVPDDLLSVFIKAGDGHGLSSLMYVFFISFFIIGFNCLLVFFLTKISKRWLDQLKGMVASDSQFRTKLAVVLLQALPGLVGLVFVAVASIFIFLLLGQNVSTNGRMVFQLILGIFLTSYFIILIARTLFAPQDPQLKIIKIHTPLVKPLYKMFCGLSIMIISSLMIIFCFRDLGAHKYSIAWVGITLGTLALVVLGLQLIHYKETIKEAIITQATASGSEVDSIKVQLAPYWHLPAIFYLLVIWVVWVGQELTESSIRNGSLIISVFIIPIYFALSYYGRLLIDSVVNSLGLYSLKNPEAWEQAQHVDPLPSVQQKTPEEKKEELCRKLHTCYRVFLAISLSVWLCDLWGYTVPFASSLINAIFESIVVLSLALLCWRYTTSYIQQKIDEDTPSQEQQEENLDDEFGSAAPKARSHTLLPMVNKIVGTTLTVMVVLVIISSFGVNIGPLLAGAGVIGLAIGFGAQKLVSDVLSGFFFLLDDAFRVGEYIQAGSVRGTVESITLRNVLLRHHLGMLQVVPHSDLGAITNYMRGGIVVRFPLEFPYDTDVDKVRKIIKKVGQAMLKDPELGEDFILPVKSQGVNEIANSVMVIRVKFTAKPGKQFMIRREAFRRITEALNSKGIFYAHRKVIVDFPDTPPKPLTDGTVTKRAMEAGAAAVITEPTSAGDQT